MNIDALLKRLALEEGLRLIPYKDSVGKLTIGYGRNLDDVGISEDEAFTLLTNDVKRTVADLNRLMPWWVQLDDVRQQVICDMAFNMGAAEIATWTNWIRQLRAGQYALAAENMRGTLWARQVGQRATRLAEMMEQGTIPTEIA